MKNYIKIENCGFKGRYVFSPENGCIYRGEELDFPLFDFYEDFTNFEIGITLKILQKILYAYELGMKKEQKRISNQIDSLLVITKEND